MQASSPHLPLGSGLAFLAGHIPGLHMKWSRMGWQENPSPSRAGRAFALGLHLADRSSKPYVLLEGGTGLACRAPPVFSPTWAGQVIRPAPILKAPLCLQAPCKASLCFLLLSVQISWAKPTNVRFHLIGGTAVQSRTEMVNNISGADPITLLK